MRKCLIYFFLLCAALMFAQSNKNVEDQLFKVNALTPGISYEIGLGQNTTLNFDALLGFALAGGTDRNTDFGLFPGLQADFRYFTNMERRKRKRKNITGNSGNYLSLTNQLLSGDPLIGNLDYDTSYFYNVAVLYGIQRTRPRGFYWGVSFGPALLNDEIGTDFGIWADVRLGWVLGKGQKK